jgi:hypothetical protein
MHPFPFQKIATSCWFHETCPCYCEDGDSNVFRNIGTYLEHDESKPIEPKLHTSTISSFYCYELISLRLSISRKASYQYCERDILTESGYIMNACSFLVHSVLVKQLDGVLKAEQTSTSMASNLYQATLHRYLLSLYARYNITSVRKFWLHATIYIDILALIAAAVNRTSFSIIHCQLPLTSPTS